MTRAALLFFATLLIARVAYGQASAGILHYFVPNDQRHTMGGEKISDNFCAYDDGCNWGDYVSFIIRTAISGLVVAVVFALIGILVWILWYGFCCRHTGILRRTRLSRYGYLEGKKYTRPVVQLTAVLAIISLLVCALLAIGILASSAVVFRGIDNLTDAFNDSIRTVETALRRLLIELDFTNGAINNFVVPPGFAQFVQQSAQYLRELKTSIRDNADDIDDVNIGAIVVASVYAFAVLLFSLVGLWNVLRPHPSPRWFTALASVFLFLSVFLWLVFVLWLVIAILLYDSCQNMKEIIQTSFVSPIFNSVYDCPRYVVSYAASYVQTSVAQVTESACVDASAICSRLPTAVCPSQVCASDPVNFISQIGILAGNTLLNVTECSVRCTGADRLASLELSRDLLALNLLPLEVANSVLLRGCAFILDLIRTVNHSLCHTAPHALFASITMGITLATFILPLAALMATANRRLNPACWAFDGPLW